MNTIQEPVIRCRYCDHEERPPGGWNAVVPNVCPRCGVGDIPLGDKWAVIELRDPSAAAQAQLREIMKAMKPKERVELWQSLQDGYCPHCGSEYMPCHCWNDE